MRRVYFKVLYHDTYTRNILPLVFFSSSTFFLPSHIWECNLILNCATKVYTVPFFTSSVPYMNILLSFFFIYLFSSFFLSLSLSLTCFNKMRRKWGGVEGEKKFFFFISFLLLYNFWVYSVQRDEKKVLFFKKGTHETY